MKQNLSGLIIWRNGLCDVQLFFNLVDISKRNYFGYDFGDDNDDDNDDGNDDDNDEGFIFDKD